MNRPPPANRLARVLQAEAARNGHKLPGAMASALAAGGTQSLEGKQIVQFDPFQSAVFLLDAMLPGKPMPVFAGGQMIPGQQIDWTEYAEKLRASLPAGDWTPLQTHHFNVANAVAQFQRSSMACAAAAGKLRGTPVADALPEPPAEDRAPEGMGDGQ